MILTTDDYPEVAVDNSFQRCQEDIYVHTRLMFKVSHPICHPQCFIFSHWMVCKSERPEDEGGKVMLGYLTVEVLNMMMPPGTVASAFAS